MRLSDLHVYRRPLPTLLPQVYEARKLLRESVLHYLRVSLFWLQVLSVLATDHVTGQRREYEGDKVRSG